ncbi:MAG: MerR family transcriptional regulator [Chloroflexi bacterium]|nr:MerR family transcriptional regulator [Chloroflexota bacterium]
MLSTTPTYNIKVVLKETNLPADTLRAWERRYGLPAPQRTEGGHRLYSQYDIETIKWLIARMEEGLSISSAVELWNERMNAGLDPLAGSMPTTQTLPAIYVPTGTTLDSIRVHWLEAVLSFKETESEQALNKAFTMFPVESVCMEVLQKGLAEIGRLWYENKASVQQEHFASGLVMRRLDSLMSAAPVPTSKQTVMVGCPAGEEHTFAALLLALLLRRHGLNVVYLGANVPVDQFEGAIKSTDTNLVILVAQSLITAASLQTTVAALSEMNIPIAFGGRIFNTQPGLENHVAGYYLGDTVQDALKQTEIILKKKTKPNIPGPVSQKYQNTLRGFIANRTHIESTLKESLSTLIANSAGVHTGIQFLGDNISAALQLGDMEYVTQEMEWVKVLMQSQKRSPQEMATFLQSYSSAVDKHINGTGAPIKAWLKTQAYSAS